MSLYSEHTDSVIEWQRKRELTKSRKKGMLSPLSNQKKHHFYLNDSIFIGLVVAQLF